MERQIKVSTLKITFENELAINNLKGTSLLSIIESIKKLPIDLHNPNSRYTRSKTGNELAVIFADEIKNFKDAKNDVIVGAFLKRRGNDPLLEDDGTGHLITLTLKDETHAIAEVSYFGIHIDSGILFWTYNPFVGGINQFTKYLNEKIHLLKTMDEFNHIPEDDSPDKRLGFYYIGQPRTYEIFKQNMDVISSLEFRLAGNADFFCQAFLSENDDRDRNGMRLLRYFTENSNCGVITVKLSTEKAKRSKNKKEQKEYTLTKEFIVSLYENTREHLFATKNSKFNVKGKTVDEETNVLDLVHARLMFVLTILLDENAETHVICSMNEMRSLIYNKIDIAIRNYGNEVE
jgi:hypothetical protein